MARCGFAPNVSATKKTASSRARTGSSRIRVGYAYHVNKLERGNDIALDVWGSDHHATSRGSKVRCGRSDSTRSASPSHSYSSPCSTERREGIDVHAGGRIRHAARTATRVGNDAARFFYVLRKSDQHLDFDLDLAKSQSNEPGVLYIQYAHAVSVVSTSSGGKTCRASDDRLSSLDSEHEHALLEKLAAYPDALENAARDFAPHVMHFYLKSSPRLPQYYNATRILARRNRCARTSRLATAVGQVLRNGSAWVFRH